jgi:undecaprenyl diphosphate synthase
MQTILDRKLHVGILMDGNGRWGERRNLGRSAGHRAGVEAIRRVVEAAIGQRVGTLTLYGFSSDNWGRPRAEVDAIFALMRSFVDAEIERFIATGIRLSVIGRRDRLPDGLAEAFARAEALSAAGSTLHLRIAVDYSGRDAILAAARRAGGREQSREEFSILVAGDDSLPPVDLIIRAGGERRLSDFLLWESAYAELWFTDRLWPDFGGDDLAEALSDFRSRQRRFGLAPSQVAA